MLNYLMSTTVQSTNRKLVVLPLGDNSYIILILLEPKVISLCHHHRARPPCTSMQSEQALYCWLTKFTFIYIDIPKNDNGQIKKMANKFQKFIRLMIKLCINIHEVVCFFFSRIKQLRRGGELTLDRYEGEQGR